MTSISITEILTIIFVLVDDWYQIESHKLLQEKAGRKPVFTDSEVITLMLAQDFIPCGVHSCQLPGFVSQTDRSKPIQPPSTSIAFAGRHQTHSRDGIQAQQKSQ